MATILGDSSDNRLVGTSLADLIQGLDGNDTLEGVAGNDTLQGGDGNDWLTGGPGNDRLEGGGGVDTARYDAETANLVVDLASSVQFDGDPGNADTLSSIENVRTGSGNDSIFGYSEYDRDIRAGAGDDTVAGSLGDDLLVGQAGRDSLSGDAGDDTLVGGGGFDSLIGGDGRDIASYASETAAIFANVDTGGVYFPSGHREDYLFSIEGFITGSGRDTLIGGDSADDLRAGAGADILRGGRGADTLDGGPGSDTIYGGAGPDTVRYASHGRAMTIDLAHQTASAIGTSAFTDYLHQIENASGGQGGDLIYGSSLGQHLDGVGGNDTIFGLGGDDTIEGGLGRDLLQGGAGDDTFLGARILYDYAFYDSGPWLDRFYASLIDDGLDTIQGGTGTDTIYVPNAYFQDFHAPTEWLVDANVNLIAGTLRVDLPGATTDRIASIENVTTTEGDDTVQGDGGDNLLSVGDGANLVHGAGGDDTLIGGAVDTEDPDSFQDRLYGEAGNDLLVGNGSVLADPAGTALTRDLLNGGSGDDTLVGGVWRAEMVGGPGADQFQSSNRVATIYEPFGEIDVGARPLIRDFDPTEGDVIAIEVVDNPDDVTPVFVGEVDDLDDLGQFELGYIRDGNDTLLQFGPDESESEDALHIQLADYSGPLTSDDLLFL